MNTRPVEWRDYSRAQGSGMPELKKALFHQWGTDFEELRDGVGTYSTAIIETPDGTVKNVPAENIKFLDREG